MNTTCVSLFTFLFFMLYVLRYVIRPCQLLLPLSFTINRHFSLDLVPVDVGALPSLFSLALFRDLIVIIMHFRYCLIGVFINWTIVYRKGCFDFA